MENWIQEAISQWKQTDVKLNPGATEVDFEKAEAILEYRFPDDFKKLYIVANGFVDWDMQEHNFSFWPLDRIIEQFEKDDNKSFIGFSDYLINCHNIGFVRNTSGIFKDYVVNMSASSNYSGKIITVKNFDGTYKQYLNVIDKMADTFEEAVLMINNGDGLIY